LQIAKSIRVFDVALPGLKNMFSNNLFMTRFWTTALYKTVHFTPVKIFQLNTAPIAYFTVVGDPKKGIKNRAKMLQKNKKRT
jgi:hypothetical protein